MSGWAIAIIAGIALIGACALAFGLYEAGRNVIADAVKAAVKWLAWQLLPALLRSSAATREKAQRDAREGRMGDPHAGREK